VIRPQGRPTPRRSPPWIRGADDAVIKHAEHADRCGEQSDNAIRSQSRKSGAEANYLVGGGGATQGYLTDDWLRLVGDADPRGFRRRPRLEGGYRLDGKMPP
jgi:hypothetical protein